jgi:FkbM family methyltransferase
MSLKLDHPERVFINELRALGRGKLFVDVGSHVGWYTINLADCYDEVWCFEPYRLYADGLRENLKKFGITNVSVFEKAVGDKAGTSPFFGNEYALRGQDCPSLKQDLVLSYEGRSKRLPIQLGTVETTTLTDILGNRTADLVKIDTEGNEKSILYGAKAVMNQVKAFHVEVHDWADMTDIRRVLKAYGFCVRERGLDGREKGWLIAVRAQST